MNNKMDYYISSSKSCKNIYDLHAVEQFPLHVSRRDCVKKGNFLYLGIVF